MDMWTADGMVQATVENRVKQLAIGLAGLEDTQETRDTHVAYLSDRPFSLVKD